MRLYKFKLSKKNYKSKYNSKYNSKKSNKKKRGGSHLDEYIPNI